MIVVVRVGWTFTKERSTVDCHLESLLNSKLNFSAVNSAVFVVNVNKSSDTFVWHEDILLELGSHLGCTLVKAAACCDLTGLFLFLSLFEGNGWLPNNQKLFVLHSVVIVMSDKFCLNSVLDLSLWLLLLLLFGEVE